MKILMVLTSHDQLGNTGKKTGFWLEEFAAPYYAFLDAGADITLASPKGGQPPLDPKSDEADAQTEATERFRKDSAAQAALASTSKLSTVQAASYDAVFYPGGHGPLWDLAEDKDSIADGSPLVKGKKGTGFSDSEEAAVQLTDIVPFLVEAELKRLGGNYSKLADWQSYAVADGNLITGQNPASSVAVAQQVLNLLD